MNTVDQNYAELNELSRQFYCENNPEVKELTLKFNENVSESAREILKNSIVIDSCSFHLEGYNWQLEEGGITAINCTVPGSFDRAGLAVRNITDYYTMARRDPKLLIAYTADDIVRAKKEGKVAVIIGAQNCDFLFHNELEAMVEIFYRMGLRVVGIGYNHSSFAADGCFTGTNAGLTNEGRELIRCLNKFGITMDLSHCGYRSAEEAIDICQGIPVFTHTNPSTIYDHPRNISDDLIKKCAEKGGVIGICAYRVMVWDGKKFPTTDDFVNMIQYVADLVGIDHVGIGLDSNASPGAYDRRDNKHFSDLERDQGGTTSLMYKAYTAGRGFKSLCVDGIAGLANFPNIVECMLKHGFSEADIKKVIGENWLRVFRQTWR